MEKCLSFIYNYLTGPVFLYLGIDWIARGDWYGAGFLVAGVGFSWLGYDKFREWKKKRSK